MIPKVAILALLFLAAVIADRDWDEWSQDLNDNISNRVRDLDNLGERISASVRRNLQGLDNLGSRISQQVQNDVRRNLPDLSNLGSQINQQVHNGLRPVREMQSRFRVKFGNDGTTIATYNDGRQFILRNGVLYQCSGGTINTNDGTCSGALKKFDFPNKRDFCYSTTRSIINNWYCLSNGGVNSGVINGNVYCNSADGTPTLLISGQEYRNLCANGPTSVTYKYFSNVAMGDRGPELNCNNGTPVVCTMTENITYSNIIVGNSGSNGLNGNSYVVVNK